MTAPAPARVYEFLLLDLDDTILDFARAEEQAYNRTLADWGLSPSPGLLAEYRQVNDLWWKRYERGEVDRDTLLVARHRDFFARKGIRADPAAFEAAYLRRLGEETFFVPGAREALGYLRKRGYRLYLVSNGVAELQTRRLKNAGILDWFEERFISETTGSQKPQRPFFDYCFARIPGFSREKTLLMGDSLTSDIRGGKNAGVDTMWYNPGGQIPPSDLRPTYEIVDYAQLSRIL